jgi:aspartate racemase
MEQDFYQGRLRDGHGIEALVPDEAGRSLVHRIIYEELCRGVVIPQSKAACLAEIDRLRGAGADRVILGCTEIGLLIQPSDLPVFDTTRIHVQQALGFALGPG